MKCDKHPEMDAVGTCSYCGRGVCDQCTVRMHDKIHCKECVEAGRVRGAPEPGPRPQDQINGPYPVLAHPYLPVPNILHMEAKPVGIPDPELFRNGMNGSLYCCVLSLANAFYSVIGPAMLGSSSFPGLVYLLLYTLMLPGLLLVVRGYLGFLRNYGYAVAYKCGIFVIIAMGVDIIIWVLAHFLNEATSMFDGGYRAGVMVFGIALLFTGLPIWGIRDYYFPRSDLRMKTTLSFLLLVLGGVFILTVFGSFLLGWALAVPGFFMLSQIFARTPLPVTTPRTKFAGN